MELEESKWLSIKELQERWECSEEQIINLGASDCLTFCVDYASLLGFQWFKYCDDFSDDPFTSHYLNYSEKLSDRLFKVPSNLAAHYHFTEQIHFSTHQGSILYSITQGGLHIIEPVSVHKKLILIPMSEIVKLDGNNLTGLGKNNSLSERQSMQELTHSIFKQNGSAKNKASREYAMSYLEENYHQFEGLSQNKIAEKLHEDSKDCKNGFERQIAESTWKDYIREYKKQLEAPSN